MANLLLSVMGAFAEFAWALIGERQREGIRLAKLLRHAGAGAQKSTLALEFGVSREALYQYSKTAPTPSPGFAFHRTLNPIFKRTGNRSPQIKKRYIVKT